MSKNGYDFYLKKCLLPIAPEKLQVKINNANDTLTLINEGEINILKTPELTDIEFECRIPQVKYPFATYKSGFKGASYFLDYFESLKADKKPFQFIVSRTLPNGKVLFSTNMKVSMEDYKITEQAKDGFDLTVKIKLKQYRDYGTKTVNIKIAASKPKAKVEPQRPADPPAQKSYKVGDIVNFHGGTRKYDAAPDQLDTQALTDALLAAMQRGLRGEPGGLPMLPAYLAPGKHLPDTEGKRVAVVDAGGTHFRVATVRYEFGHPVLENERKLPMPGTDGAADWTDFIRLTADALAPLLADATHIGICFSYPAQNTPELDAKVLSMTKEVQLTGWEEHLVGADLAEELTRRGCPKLPIAVVNDTPATYLSGVATISNNYANGFAGLVNGTGTNTCCLLPVRAIEKLGRDEDGAMLVNLESGSFSALPQSSFDQAVDAASAAPGAYRLEKMTSGRYLGELCRLSLIAAADDGLFAAGTADKLRALGTLSASDADTFGADPDSGAIAALSDAADADRKTAAMVIQGVFGRAAKVLVANVAAMVLLTGGAQNRHRPMVVAVDGSLFRNSALLHPAVNEELDRFLVQKLQRYCVCKPISNASAVGAAAAALLQG